MTRLVVARHGNTFGVGDIVRRVGARTDLPLAASGVEQARKLGRYLADNNLLPDRVYTSELQRARQTANYALAASGVAATIMPRAAFNEIDYGPDENQTDDHVIARIGRTGLRAWEEHGIVPPGWVVDPLKLQAMWRDFGADMARDLPDATILVVTSNGIARFAPYLTGNYPAFIAKYKPKMATGALSILDYKKNGWGVTGWNIRP
jgi:probable phosphoglycerate mutase